MLWHYLGVLNALLLGLLSLVGVNAVWHELGWDRLTIGRGLLLAVGVFTLASFIYMRTATRARWALAWSVGLSAFLVVGVPWILQAADGGDESLADATPERVRSKVDLLIVTGPAVSGEAEGLPVGSPFSVRYFVGRLEGAGITWDDRGRAPGAEVPRGVSSSVPETRPSADVAVVLFVPKGATRAPWIAAARRLKGDGSGVFAVLPQWPDDQLRRWRDALSPQGVTLVDGAQYSGRATAEVALSLAIRSPTADQSMVLAQRFRPILLFDGRETLTRPTNIDEFFASGRVSLCFEETLGRGSCEEIRDPSDLVNGSTHLRLDLAGLEEGMPVGRHALPDRPTRDSTTIYVHPVEDRDAERLYLDYWWYLPINRTPVGRGVLCAAGFAIYSATCFDHHSDWEGVTVVVDTSGERARPVAVHYAEHESVIAYQWTDLRRAWDDANLPEFNLAPEDAAERPLVYVSEGSHASYPLPCRRTPCRQTGSQKPEGRHDGAVAWEMNDTDRCVVSACLQEVPTRAGGTEPALWNAFTGPWGEVDCFSKYFCSVGGAPSGPAIEHDRYANPADCDQRRQPGVAGSAEEC